MKSNDSLRPYLEQLRALPFVKRARAGLEADELVVAVDTLSGWQSFTVAHVRSHLAKSDVELWTGRARKRGTAHPLLLVAPYVSGPMGARLRDAGIRYLDAVGNVFLSIEGPQGVQHTALVEGRAPTRPLATERSWRAPGYQTLFTLLVRPSLLQATVRQVATIAEVSTTPVLQVRDKLVELGVAAKRKEGLAWTSGALPRARELWLRGYETTLRPSLLLQRYRPRQHMDIQALEAELEARLQERYAWRWGGAAAAFRLDPFYRGETTVVHIDAPRMSSQELTATLRMIPDPAGPVVILRKPGALAFELGRASIPLPPLVEAPNAITHVVEPRTVHPLLVWAELLEEGNDRASEAAAELAAHLLDGDEDA
jgi:hypothetical protein